MPGQGAEVEHWFFDPIIGWWQERLDGTLVLEGSGGERSNPMVTTCRNCGEVIEEETFGNDEYLEGLVAEGLARDAGDGTVALWVHPGGLNECDRMMTTAEPDTTDQEA